MKKKKEDLISVVSTNGDESPRRESAVEEDEVEEEGEPASQELDETMELDGEERPEPTDSPHDISPYGRRKASEIGLSLKNDQELLRDYEEKAAEDRRQKGA